MFSNKHEIFTTPECSYCSKDLSTTHTALLANPIPIFCHSKIGTSLRPSDYITINISHTLIKQTVKSKYIIIHHKGLSIFLFPVHLYFNFNFFVMSFRKRYIWIVIWQTIKQLNLAMIFFILDLLLIRYPHKSLLSLCVNRAYEPLILKEFGLW